MTDMQRLAASIPHDYRKKILLEWLPNVRISWDCKEFKLLWEAYFVYIEPDGLKITNCPKCMSNVIKNWRNLSPLLAAEEQEYNLLEHLS